MPLLDSMRTLVKKDAAGRAARVKVRKLGQCLTAAARHGLPRAYVYFGESPGDDMLATAVLRAMHERGMPRPWYASNFPELFLNNPHVERIVPFSTQFGKLLRVLGRDVIDLHYKIPNDIDRTTPPPTEQLAAMMCRRARIMGPTSLIPEIFLADSERAAGRRVENQIAIMSTGINAKISMRNKQWFPERFQAVVNALKDRFNFVQVGVKGDMPLENVLNLCGKTSIRETAGVLSQSLCYVGNVGFLMHLARAVGTRSVIIFGGREAPWQDGYVCNENLFTPVHCAPCWFDNRCEFDRKCLKAIEPQHVIHAVGRQIERFGQTIADEVVVL